MTAYNPLVLISGVINQLPPGAGVIGGELTAGSGLTGGGVVQPGARIDVALAATPSGLIFVGDALGLDGHAQASGNAALAASRDNANLLAQAPVNATEGQVFFLDAVTTLSTVGAQLDSFASGIYASTTYQVQAKRGNEVQTSDVKLLHNNSDVYTTEYAILYSSGLLASYSGEINGGNINLNAFPNSSANTTFRVIRYAQAY